MKREIRLLKLYGFVMFMGVGTFFPYLFLYMRELGFSNAQIGILGALGPAVMMVVQPFWGWLTDKTGRPERISILLALGVAGSVALLMTGRSFSQVIIYLIIFNFFYSSQTPIYDSMVIGTVAKSDISYGQVRWLGSLGYALIAFVMGRVIELTSVPVALWNYVGLSILLAFIASKLAGLGQKDTKKDKDKTSGRIKIWPLFKNREFVIFLVAASLVIGSNAINYTFFPFLVINLGGGEGLLGLAMLISAFAEIPVFFYSSKLIKRFPVQILLLVAFGVTALRWFLYSVSTSPYHLLGLQLLHSITFGLMYASAVVYVSRLTPDKLRASGQNLFWAATFGFGHVVANLVGGWVYQYYPVQLLFILAGGAATVGTVILLCGTIVPGLKSE